MRKECRTLCGLFVVLIVFCVTSPVVGQQSNTGSTVLQYTKTIDAEKLMKNIEDLTTSVDKLTDSQKELTDNVKKMGEKYTKDIRELNDKVIAIDERTKNIRDIGIGILVALIVGILLYVLFGRNQKIQYIQQPAPRLIELDQKEQKEQEEQRKYEYQPEGVIS